jgi:TolB-like protein/tetratricopeptide (TPR) repeat protein/phage shock protein PspC (stress-responsive transcriptional regulator)
MSASLRRELGERKLVQWAVAYLAGAWLVLQVLDLIGNRFGWPDTLLRALIVLLAAGFLAVLVIAWYHGEHGRQRVSGPELLMLGGILVAASVGMSLVGLGREPGEEASLAPGSEANVVGRAVPTHRAAVAVLPFDELDDASVPGYFGEGITDEIIGELAKVEGLKVISRTSVVALRGTGLTLMQIADTLGVGHVVEGSVRRSDRRVRISARLIDPATDTQLWSDTFDREITDVFSVQEDVARRIVLALLSRVEVLRPRNPASRTRQSAAYDAYLRGTFARQRMSGDQLRTATEAFEEAIALDPAYAPAYAGLSEVHVLWALFAYPGGPEPYAGAARALAMADRAVALDPELAEAFAARGHARLRAWFPSDSVVPDLENAVRLAPNSSDARLLHAVALAFAGRFEEAVRASETAVLLDPLSPGAHDFRGMSLVLNRRYEEAISEARTAQALAPRFLNPRRQEARSLLLLGRYAECMRMDTGPYLGLRAMCRHSSGDVSGAAAIIEGLVGEWERGGADLPLQRGAIAGDIAEYHAWIGDTDGALRWLRRSAELSPVGQFLVTETATYDRVRGEPRFVQQLERIRREIRARVERERS